MKSKVMGAILLRVVVIMLVLPPYSHEFFAPFLNSSFFNFDPWSQWIDSGGDPRAFPYGLAMMIVYIPSLLIYKILQLLSIDGPRVFEMSIAFQLLAVEGLLWRFIYKTNSMRKSLGIFLFSPLIIWVNYFLGLNDFFPSIILFFAAYFLLSRKYKFAGLLIGIAIGMKFSLALILPFLVLFAWDNPRFGRKIWTTFLISTFVGVAMHAPGTYSQGFREMVFNNKESIKALEYSISLASNQVLVLPVIYLLLLYWLWKAGRISVEVLIAFFGISLFLISAFSPASLGWMLWGLPLMFMILSKEKKSRVQLVLIQSIFICFTLLKGIEIQSTFALVIIPKVGHLITDLLFTCGIALTVIYSFSSLKTAIRHGDLFKIAQAPLTVSIAGDSGTGKDTLTQALIKIFPPDTATILCGDDYHKYERGDSSWENTTHLNPVANFLDLWERDYNLAHQRMYFEQREYDHYSGKFSSLKPRFRRDLLVSQGLHALYPQISDKSDVKIFLTMDQDLRIKLKMHRDSSERGQSREVITESIKKREKDYRLYVAPQVHNCDIHFHLYGDLGQLNLKVTSAKSYFLEQILSDLGALVKIDYESVADSKMTSYIIEPNYIQEGNLIKVIKDHIRDYHQLFLKEPDLPSGALGIIVTLTILLLAIKRCENNA